MYSKVYQSKLAKSTIFFIFKFEFAFLLDWLISCFKLFKLIAFSFVLKIKLLIY